jgi:hypothetical protein
MADGAAQVDPPSLAGDATAAQQTPPHPARQALHHAFDRLHFLFITQEAKIAACGGLLEAGTAPGAAASGVGVVTFVGAVGFRLFTESAG